MMNVRIGLAMDDKDDMHFIVHSFEEVEDVDSVQATELLECEYGEDELKEIAKENGAANAWVDEVWSDD